MQDPKRLKRGDVNAMVRVAQSASARPAPLKKEVPPQTALSKSPSPESSTAPAPTDDQAHLRKVLADFCRLLGPQPSKPSANPPPLMIEPGLPPRLRQTLVRLLSGDSEKQIASLLNISPHTVHAYVKSLHKHYRVSSRGELLARFITQPPGK